MTTVFSRIIAGEIPGRFVWGDEQCVVFLTAAPLRDGHVLVVSREEVEQWTDASPELLGHLMEVARRVGRAQQTEWACPRVGLLLQGFEVPHVHVHVWPAFSPEDFDLSRADQNPDPARLDEAAARLRSALRGQGDGVDEHVPAEPS